MAAFENENKKHRDISSIISITDGTSSTTTNEGLQHTNRIGASFQGHLAKSSARVGDYRRKESCDLVSDVEYFLTCILDNVVAHEEEGLARYIHPNKPHDAFESYVEQEHRENIDPIFPEADLAIAPTTRLGYTPLVEEGNTQDVGQIPEDLLPSVVPDGVTYYKFPEVDEDIPDAKDTCNTTRYSATVKDTGNSTQYGAIVKYSGSGNQYGTMVKCAARGNQYDTMVKEKIKQWEPAGSRKTLTAELKDLLLSVCNDFLPALTNLPCHMDEASRCRIRGRKLGMTTPNSIEGKWSTVQIPSSGIKVLN